MVFKRFDFFTFREYFILKPMNMLQNFFLPLLKDWAWVIIHTAIGVGLIYVGVLGGLSLVVGNTTSLPTDFKTCVAISGLVSVTVGVFWLKRYTKTK